MWRIVFTTVGLLLYESDLKGVIYSLYAVCSAEIKSPGTIQLRFRVCYKNNIFDPKHDE
jgi:hypothetical protein